MQRRTASLLRLALPGFLLAVALLVSLLWPGPLALGDRVPLALLFGIPVLVIGDRIRRELA